MEIKKPMIRDLFTPNLGIKKRRDNIYAGQTRIVPNNEDLTVIMTALLPATLLIK